MGFRVGLRVGTRFVGFAVGGRVGSLDGVAVLGLGVGKFVGCIVGDIVGVIVGCVDGETVGNSVGYCDIDGDSDTLGLSVGNAVVGLAVVGEEEGGVVGSLVGEEEGGVVGSLVGALDTTHGLPFSETRTVAYPGLELVVMLSTLTTIVLPSIVPLHDPPAPSFANNEDSE